MTEPLHNADEELVIAIYRYFRRVRREQATQLWLHEQFSSLNQKVDRLMTTQAELATQLQSAEATLQKAFGEISAKVDTLNQQIAALQAQLNAGDVISQDLLDKAAAIQATAQQLDDLTPDVTPTA